MLLGSLPYTAMVREPYCVMVNILLFILLWLFQMLPQTFSQFVFLPGHVFWYPSWNRQMFLMEQKNSVFSASTSLFYYPYILKKLFISWECSSNPEPKVLRKVSRTRGKKKAFIFFSTKKRLVKNPFCILLGFLLLLLGFFLYFGVNQ